MIAIDKRAGSADLYYPLRSMGVPVELTDLPSGDAEFIVNGPEGRPLLTGIEYKKLPDLFQCMRDGRFADQLRRMRRSFEVSWLLIEGRMMGLGRGERLRIYNEKSGRWREQKGGITYQEVVSWLSTMSMVGGVLLWRTETLVESAEWVKNLYIWGTAKEWADHRSHTAFYSPEAIGSSPFEEPSLVERVAVSLPRIGAKKAVRVASYFGSVHSMINAGTDEWEKIKGIGKKDAKTIVDAIRSSATGAASGTA